MKYILILSQILLCCVSCVLLMGFILFLVFNNTITNNNFNKYIKSDIKYITSQKSKIQHDLNTVTSANGIDAKLFDGLINDKLIISNNEEYIHGIFDYINTPNAKLPVTTNAADGFEKGIKQVLIDYGKRTDPDQYKITQAGIDSFAALEKTTFIKSAVPIVGFETMATFIKKMYAMKNMIIALMLISILMIFGLMLLFNKRAKHISIAFILYSLCASGILISALSGYGLWVISAKNAVLSSSYLEYVVHNFFNSALVVGIIMFVVFQVVLIILFTFTAKLKEKIKNY